MMLQLLLLPPLRPTLARGAGKEMGNDKILLYKQVNLNKPIYTQREQMA